MNKEVISEISIAAVLVVLVVSLLDPFMIWMPGRAAMIVLFLAVIVFLIFTIFIWKETAQDEREEYHKLLASRYAWLAGAAVLMLGLLVQGFQYAIDQWLVYALLAMVIAKVSMRMYGRNKH